MSYNEQSPLNQGNMPNGNTFPQQPPLNQGNMPNGNTFPQQPPLNQGNMPNGNTFPQQPAPTYPGSAVFPETAAQNTTWSGVPVPTAPPKASKAKRILGILIPLLAVLLFAGLKIYRHQANQLPKPGACIQIANNKNSSDTDWKKADCSDTENMTFFVATQGTGTASCPNENYMSYSLVDQKTKSAKSYICLVPNYLKDRCYDMDPNTPVPVSCSATEADFKVAERIDAADGTCSTGEAYSFAIPDRTYCLAEPN
ncbi:MAG: LppU/SCO3897 family protein [Propionibacteriaceae bacterium]